MAARLPTKTLTVVSTLKAKPGKEPELREMLARLIHHSRKEKGCLQFDVHQAAESTGRFLLFETWQDQASFDAHMKSRHVMAVLPHVNDLCVEFPHVTIWQKI